MGKPSQACDFWARVIPGPVDCCWEFTGYISPKGYGRLKFQKTLWVSSRLAYYLANGKISKDLCVRHSCDNRACCNPAHLSLGTIAENNQDMISRNRQNQGTRNGKSKLTETQVLEIRALTDAGHKPVSLAKQFGVTRSVVSQIKWRRIWKHLT